MSWGEFTRRKQYFSNLLGNKLDEIRSFSRASGFAAIRGGRRISDQIRKKLEKGDKGPNLFKEFTDNILHNSDKQGADALLRFFEQNTLETIERFKNVLGTDKFICFFLKGQIADVFLKNLPYLYTTSCAKVEEFSQRIDYASLTYLQAIQATRNGNGSKNWSDILTKSIRIYTLNLYRPKNFFELYTDVFALTHKVGEIDKGSFDFLFSHLALNKKCYLEPVKDRFIAVNWLVLNKGEEDELKHWQKAKQVLDRINNFCARHCVVPPLRPYVVIHKEIDLKKVEATISENGFR